jgi:phosphoribosylamine---glycine ligase
MSSNVLLLGSGGREHAIAWKLRQSPRLGEMFIGPGNPGTAEVGVNVPVDLNSFEAVASIVRDRHVDLVVVGPEGPLCAGLADYLEAAGIQVYGPSKAAARVESSKSFAKRLMTEIGIPTSSAKVFTDYELAAAYVRGASAPPVVKVDGLAGGKGVTVASDTSQAVEALQTAMVNRAFGDSGATVVLEERMYGREVSAHAFTDGTRALPMPYTCDHKAVGDGNRGPNTGGMGAYSPPSFVDDRLHESIWHTVVEPAVKALTERGTPYRGTLYPGLMITDAGPQVVEFNCRFGDPETQVLMPRLIGDLLEPLMGCASGDLSGVSVEWTSDACVGVVLAAEGYPGAIRSGDVIRGIDEIDPDVLVFQAGTARSTSGEIVTAGGRVMTVVATGSTIEEARSRVYDNVSRIEFAGMHFRRDIGHQEG